MALANYSDLTSAISTWMNKNNLSGVAADFITLAEAHLNREVRIRQNMTTTQLSLVQGNSSVALPSDFLEDIELNYDDASWALNKGSFDDIDRMLTSNAGPARPALYAIGLSSIVFEVESDAAYTLNLRYYKKWAIASDTTNWLLTNAPDAYLFGAQAEAAFFQHNYNLYNLCVSRREAAIFGVRRADGATKSSTLKVDPMLVSRGTWNILTG